MSLNSNHGRARLGLVSLFVTGFAACGPLRASCTGGSESLVPKLTLAASLAATPPSIDGEFQEEGWRSAATTGAFSDPRDPTAVVAHTEARVLGDLQGL